MTSLITRSTCPECGEAVPAKLVAERDALRIVLDEPIIVPRSQALQVTLTW